MQFRRLYPFAILLVARVSAEVVMVPHPHGELSVNKTVVWSPLFQATWDKMNSQLGGPPEKIEPPNPSMAVLDATKWDSKAVMPAGSWKTWSGPATPEFLAQVNREAAALNQEADTFTLPSGLLPGAVASFGLLNRDVSFSRSLYRSKSSSLAFQTPDANLDCQFFGTAGAMSAHFHETIRVFFHDPTTKASSLEVRLVDRGEGIILHLPPAPPKALFPLSRTSANGDPALPRINQRMVLWTIPSSMKRMTSASPTSPFTRGRIFRNSATPYATIQANRSLFASLTPNNSRHSVFTKKARE